MIKNCKILALIPARMGSSCFPAKPMANIIDKRFNAILNYWKIRLMKDTSFTVSINAIGDI